MYGVRDHFSDPILDDMLSREVLIDNRENSSELEDYQVDLAIDENQLFFEAQDGLRFVDENLKIIDHWNESFPDKEWLEIAKIPGSRMCGLRMLDGNPSASSMSNGPACFPLYEDFDDISEWTLSESAGQKGGQKTDYKEEGIYSYKLWGVDINNQVTYYARLTENDPINLSDTSLVRFWYKVVNDSLFCGAYFQISPDKSSWTTLWSKGTSVNEVDIAEIDISSYSGDHYFRFHGASGGDGGRLSNFWFDGLRIREHTSPEPTAEVGAMI